MESTTKITAFFVYSLSAFTDKGEKMGKRTLPTLILFFVLILLSSCAEENQFSTLRLQLDKGTRTISPEESAMEICCYKILLTSPEGKQWGERLTYHSYCSFEDLYPGKWNIKVYGQNSNRVDLASGEIDVDLKEGDNSAYVVVDNLLGKGSLEVRISWDASKVRAPSLSLLIEKQGEEIALNSPSIDSEKGEAILIVNDLDSGSYTLRGELKSGNTIAGGFAEAVRITNGETSKGTIVLVKLGVPESNESITVSDMTSIPIDAEITGVSQLVSTGSKITASLSVNTKNVSVEDLNTKWYVNGKYQSEGRSFSYTPTEKGLHRLDAVFSTSTVGSTGSASQIFTVVDNIKDGMPYLVTTIKGNEEFTLTESHIASFLPDGKIIVADNTEKTVTIIVRDDNGTLEYYQTPYSSLKVTDCIVTDIIATGNAEDSSSTVYLVCNDIAKIIALNYIQRSNLLTWIRTEDSLYDQSDMGLIRHLGPGVSFKNKTGNIEFAFVAAATKNYDKVGLLALKKNAASTESFIASNLVSATDFVDGPIISLTADKQTSTVTAVSSFAAKVFRFHYSNDMLMIDENQILYDGDEVSEKRLFSAGLSGRITNYESGNGFLLHERGIINTTRVPGATSVIETSGSLDFIGAGIPVPFIEGSQDGEYFYIFDKYSKRLHMVLFEEKYGFDLNTGNDYITLDSDQYTALELSKDGDMALLTAFGRLDSFLLLDIIR